MADEPENQRITRLTPLADVLARMLALATPVAPREVDLSSALSCVLAQDVTAGVGLPAEARALRDGYAVRAEAVGDAGPYSPVLLGAPLRVDVGDVMPRDADAVAPLDAVAERGGRFEALAPVTAGDGVLPALGDMGAGALVAKAGWRLSGLNLTMLAATGRQHVTVRAPRVRLVTSRPGPDAVLDAIAGLLAGALRSRGCDVRRSAGDIADALADAAADAVVGVGGTGSGRNDASVRTLSRLGRVEVHGVAIAPGETVAFGIAGVRPALLLPGRVDAALAGWLMLGVTLVDRLAGSGDAADPFVVARLARKVASPIGLVEVVPVRLRSGQAEPIASGYWPLGALAQADGWISVLAGSEGYQSGSEVVVRPFP